MTLTGTGAGRKLRVLLLALLLPCGALLAQSSQPNHPPATPPPPVQEIQTPAEAGNTAAPAERPHAAAPEAERDNSQEKMIEELRHSPSVHLMARLLHVSTDAGYWIGSVVDFVILALLIAWGLKKALPKMFRARTATIRQSIDEGRKASEEAGRRLSEIEAKLARLGDEVSALRAAAERDAAGEAQRVQAAAEQEKQHIVEAADAEITAATRTARRELKALAAELAVNLAEKRIQVDEATDEALVRRFTGKLGAAAGKDGN
jgi:F-type H+-transporting ATPase subunit b